jgi:DNA-binding NarL/FixJ family response regulator
VGTKKRVFIAEDHTILREGLKAILNSTVDLEVIGEAWDGREAIRGADQYKPDLLILDLTMPKMNGLEAIKEIKKISPTTRIMILTIHDTEEYVFPALNAGADGYLLKYANQDELLTGARMVLEGKSYLTPGISDEVIHGYLGEKKGLKPKSSWDTVTRQERRVLKLIAEGFKTKEIADYLCISPKTAAKHRANLMGKLDLHTVAALTAFAIGKGLIDEQ